MWVKGKDGSPPVLSKQFISQEAKRRRLEGRNVSQREKDLMHRAYIAGVHAAKFRKKSRSNRTIGASESVGGTSRARSFLNNSPVTQLPSPAALTSLMSPPLHTHSHHHNPHAHPHHHAHANTPNGGRTSTADVDDEAFDKLFGLGNAL